MKAKLLQAFKTANTKDLVHKLSDCLVEIAGSMYEEDNTVWKELTGLIF